MLNKIMVIGSNSFSGSDFIDLLLENGKYDCVGVSRSVEKNALFLPYKRHKGANFRFYQLDLNKDMQELMQLLDSFEPEYVVNFAGQSEVAPSWEHPGQWFQTNTVALANLVSRLRTRKYLKCYLHISSPEVYGTCSGSVDEDTHLNPSTPYAASKAAADLLLRTFQRQFALPLLTVRSTNVYGAYQQLFKIIPRSVINARVGRTIDLHGAGKAVKSYIHVRDVSRGELAILERGSVGQLYHLSPDEGVSVRDLVRMICNRIGVSFEEGTCDVAERPGQDAAYVIDSTRAREELGWLPEISLREGIDQVVSWIESHWDQIQKEPLEFVYKP